MGQPQMQPQGQRAPQTPAPTSDETVSVACKLPCGFVLRGFRPSEETEAVLGGGTRDVTYHRPSGEAVTIRGTSVRAGLTPPILVNGYRVTPGVPKRLWDQWLAANKDSDLVRNHIVFAHGSTDHIAGWAREHEKALTGLEGIDPDDPSKRVRGIQRAERPK